MCQIYFALCVEVITRMVRGIGNWSGAGLINGLAGFSKIM